MALDDYVEPEVAVAVAVTAAVLSPPVRKVMRKGAVYGMAGLLMAGDALSAFAKGAMRGAQQAANAAGNAVQSAANTGGAAETAQAAANAVGG
jgi:hypothetical protein